MAIDLSLYTAYSDGSIHGADPDALLDGVFNATKELDFESGIVGDLASGIDAFNPAYTRSIYDDTVASIGTQSVKSVCPVGAEGFGIWGGEINFDAADRPSQGDTFWIRWDSYLPTNAYIAGGPGFLKHMRVGVTTDVGGSIGSHDFLFGNSGGFIYGNEVPTTGSTIDNLLGSYVKGAWESYEMAIYLHPTEGSARVWRGDQLIGEFLNIQTIRASTDVIYHVLVNTNYNSGAPMQLGNISGTFGVGNSLSSGGEGGGPVQSAFSTVAAILDTNVLRIAQNNSGYDLMAGDIITDDVTGASGTLLYASEDSWVDNIITTIERPTYLDDQGNYRIGPLKQAVS